MTLLITGATGFRGFDCMPDAPATVIASECAKRLTASARGQFVDLRTRHIASHQALFRRVSLVLPVLGPRTSRRTSG